MNNILRNVLMRRSTTQFDSRPILDEAMIEILEEGKVLSNAPNNQEWHFTVLQNRDLLRRFHVLYERLVEEKRGDAVRASAQMVADLPVVLIISASKNEPYVEDAAHMVFGSMMLVAEKAGLGSCWLSTAADMFHSEDGKKLLAQLSIPQGYAPLCIGAFGYKRAAAPPRVLSSEDNIVNIIK